MTCLWIFCAYLRILLLEFYSNFINFSAAELHSFWFSQESAFFKMDGSLGTWDLYVAFWMFSWCFFLLDELPDKGRSELQMIWTISMLFEPLQLFPWVSQRFVIVPGCATFPHLMGSAAGGGVCTPVTRCGSLPSPEQAGQMFHVLPSVSGSFVRSGGSGGSNTTSGNGDI